MRPFPCPHFHPVIKSPSVPDTGLLSVHYIWGVGQTIDVNSPSSCFHPPPCQMYVSNPKWAFPCLPVQSQNPLRPTGRRPILPRYHTPPIGGVLAVCDWFDLNNGNPIGIMVFSRCIVHHTHELQSGKFPSLLAKFHRGTSPFGRSHSDFWESTEFSVDNHITQQIMMAAPVMRCIFFVVGHFNVDFKCYSHLITCFKPVTGLCMHCLFVCAIQCKVLLFVFVCLLKGLM